MRSLLAVAPVQRFVRLPSRLWRTGRRLVCTEGDAEPHIQVAARRCAREAKGGAADLRDTLSPTAASHNTNSVPDISHGIFGTQVPVGSQPVLTPLPDVAVHVVESEPVRQEFTDRRREHIAILRHGGLPVRKPLLRCSVGNVAHLDQGFRRVTAVKALCRTRPSSVLPLRICWQSHRLLAPLREPTAEGVCVVPSHIYHRVFVRLRKPGGSPAILWLAAFNLPRILFVAPGALAVCFRFSTVASLVYK